MNIKKLVRPIYYNGEVVSEITLVMDTANPKVVEVHHIVYKWSAQIYKEALLLWEIVKKSLKEGGVEQIVTVCPVGPDSEKAAKYWKMMGFQHIYNKTVMGTEVTLGEMEI